MDNLSEKVATVVVKYTDLDNNLTELSTSGSLTGNIGDQINYSTADEIKNLTNQGYVLVNNTFDSKGKPPVFSGDQDSYIVTFKHGREKVTVDNLKYGCKLEDLQVKGTQTIHYVGAGSRTPRDEVSTITFNRILVYDRVTGKKIGSKGWERVEQSFPVVAAPSILGYIPDKVLVGGKSVTADEPNREYTITYGVNEHISNKEQKAEVKYLDIDSNNEEIIESEILTGKPNTKIDYSTIDQLKKLNEKGYEVVSNGFDANGDIQFFDTSDDYIQTFIVTLKHKQVLVNKKNSLEGIDESEYHKTTKRVISYAGAGDKTPAEVVQAVSWDRNLTVDAATKRVISDGKYTTDWKPEQETYPAISVPVVSEYHTRIKEVPEEKVRLANITEKIRYVKNGYVVPVNEKGEKIDSLPKLRFVSDKNDPTLVTLPENNLEDEKYEPEDINLTEVDPANNLEVKYILKHKFITINKDNSHFDVNPGSYRRTATALVRYEGAGDKNPKDSIQTVQWNRNITYDEVTKEILEDGKYTTDWKPDKEYFEAVDTPVISGFTADIGVVAKHDVTQSDLFATVTYQKNGAIIPVDEDGKEISKAKPVPFLNDLTDPTRVLATEEVPEIEGYRRTQEAVLIKNPVKDIKVKYILKPRYVQVDSDHPYRTVKPHNYSIPVKETIHYVGAGDTTPVDRVQGARWNRSLTVNDNNGKLIENGKYTTDWTVDKKQYSTVVTPVVDGYHADQYQVKACDVSQENIDIEIKYQRNGQIVPVNTKGEKIEHADQPIYITDPTDATKVLMEQPVPRLLNYLAEDSSIVVKDPSRDTKVTYYTFDEIKGLVANKNLKAEIQSVDSKDNVSNIVSLPVSGKRRKAIVTFVDLSNNATQIASSSVLSGNVGDKITDLYSTSDQINKLKKDGYEVVYNGFDPKGATKYFDEDQRRIATFTVAVEKVTSPEPKDKVDSKEETSEKTSKIEGSTEDINLDQENVQDHKVLKHIFPWMK
ncbi:MAG: hypothetical protein K2O75_07695 [Lactobacillus sp.]|uniref:mucin-binding protein n=1 Tax=Lactobacillus sp. TaxID=1591 RepID=UPI0023CD8DA5|nr:hypothetical protein [Lactobacillus sp.]MDE7050729.1 hypothetical protein [Lactobacillus sp.]